MGASFRNIDQIRQLAGCDLLTIAPDLLNQLQAAAAPLPRQLQPDVVRAPAAATPLTEAEFLWQLNEDAMACEKLAEGIRKFAVDQIKLEQLLSQLMQEPATH